MAGEYDFEIRPGNTGIEQNAEGLVATFRDSTGTEEDLTGYTFVFTTSLISGQKLVKTSDGGDITIAGGKVTVPFTVADSRLFEGKGFVRYELEQRSLTSERTRLFGKIHVVGGVNND